MLYKKVTKKISPINGIGLFAEESIKKDEAVLGSSPKLDLEISQEEFDRLNEYGQSTLRQYGFKTKDGKWHLNFDDVRFLNHSENPNITQSSDPNILIASKDIGVNEELTQDYHEFENPCRFD